MKNTSAKNFIFDPNHVPSNAFKQQLKQQVLTAYTPNERVTPMKKIYIFAPLALASIAALAGASYVLFKNDKTPIGPVAPVTQTTNQVDTLKQVTISPKYTTGSGGDAAGTSMPGQSTLSPRYKTIEAATKAVGFAPFYLTKPVQNEQLTELYSTVGLSGGNETMLYMSYGTTEMLYYQILQTKVLEDTSSQVPPEVERVQLTIAGKQITAFRNEFWNETTPASDIYPGTPRQTVSFMYEGVSVEITEYGTITLAQIKDIAASLAR